MNKTAVLDALQFIQRTQPESPSTLGVPRSVIAVYLILRYPAREVAEVLKYLDTEPSDGETIALEVKQEHQQ
jgi:hypothetical protein